MSFAEVINDLWRRLNPVLVVTVSALWWAINHSVLYATVAFTLIAFAIFVEVSLMVFGVARLYRDNQRNNSLYRCTVVRLFCALPLVPVLLVAGYSAYWLRSQPGGAILIWWPVVVTIAADVGAYAGGRFFGGPIVNATISGGKTWSGIRSAVVAGGTIGFGFITAHNWGSWLPLISSDPAGLLVLLYLFLIASLLQAGTAMAADLGGSALKRVCGVKDSSRLFGAHGGILDRLGSHLPAVIVAASSVHLLQQVF